MQHGFREGWGTGLDDLEARLSQKLSRLAQKPLFQVFLGVHKAYNSLDMGRCLEILRGIGWVRTWSISLATTVNNRGLYQRREIFSGRLSKQGEG